MKRADQNDRIRAALSNLVRILQQETQAERFDAHLASIVLLDRHGGLQIRQYGCTCDECQVATAVALAEVAGIALNGATCRDGSPVGMTATGARARYDA